MRKFTAPTRHLNRGGIWRQKNIMDEIKKKETRGRKPIPKKELAIPVTVYVKAARIKELGGIDKARNISKAALENGDKKQLKK